MKYKNPKYFMTVFAIVIILLSVTAIILYRFVDDGFFRDLAIKFCLGLIVPLLTFIAHIFVSNYYNDNGNKLLNYIRDKINKSFDDL